jgi:hypothetical protein
MKSYSSFATIIAAAAVLLLTVLPTQANANDVALRAEEEMVPLGVLQERRMKGSKKGSIRSKAPETKKSKTKKKKHLSARGRGW